MQSLSDNNQVKVIETFNSTSRYLYDLLNIDNHFFEHMVSQMYPAELQLNKANSSDTEAPLIWTCPLAMTLFHLKFTITELIIILK